MKFFVCLCASRSLLKARSSMHAVRSFTFGSFVFARAGCTQRAKPWRQVTSPSACARPPAPTTSHSNRGKPRSNCFPLQGRQSLPRTYTEQVRSQVRSLSKALRRGPPTQRWWQRPSGWPWLQMVRIFTATRWRPRSLSRCRPGSRFRI